MFVCTTYLFILLCVDSDCMVEKKCSAWIICSGNPKPSNGKTRDHVMPYDSDFSVLGARPMHLAWE